MFAGIASALSGVQAGSRLLSGSAHNIANALTDDFKRTETTFQESSAGGVVVSLTQDQRPGLQVSTGDDPQSDREGSNVNLAEELVDALAATRIIEANLASIRAQDDAIGSLLDLVE